MSLNFKYRNRQRLVIAAVIFSGLFVGQSAVSKSSFKESNLNNNNLIECRIEKKDHRVHLVLSTQSSGKLTVQRSSQTTQCDVSYTDFDDHLFSRLSAIKFKIKSEKCAGPEKEKILKELTLRAEVKPTLQPRATLDWATDLDSEYCALSSLQLKKLYKIIKN